MVRVLTRQQAEARGRRAELAASVLLMLKGYQIIARRALTGMGEIDLVARKGRVLAIVEVKSRPSLAQCLEAVTPKQQGRLARAALAWIAPRQWAQKLALRFDVVAAPAGRLPTHIRDAFRPDRDILSERQ